MQFRVPKYLERESTIAFGLTFKRLAILGGMGLILFILYYVVPNKGIFFTIAIFSAGVFALFNFVKIREQSLSEVATSMVKFIFTSHIYFWQKRGGLHPITVIKKKKQSDGKKAPLRLSPQSRLHDIGSKIDLGMAELEEELQDEL